MQRDFSNTGAIDGAIFIKIRTKEAVFELPGGKTASAFAGFFDSASLIFKDADPQNELPARWHFDLKVSAKIGDESPKAYTISLSSYWNNPILGNLVNGLRGALDTNAWQLAPHNRYIRLWLSLKQPVGKRAYCSMSAFLSEQQGDFLPAKYPWNDARQQYEGVPSDMAEANAFWLGVARGIVEITGGVIVGLDKATIPLPATIDGPQAGAVPASATPTQQPQQGPAPAKVTADGFWATAEKNYMTGKTGETLLAGLNATLAGLEKLKPEGVTQAQVFTRFNQLLSKVAPGSTFLLQGKTAVIMEPTPADPTITDAGDDLPF